MSCIKSITIFPIPGTSWIDNDKHDNNHNKDKNDNVSSTVVSVMIYMAGTELSESGYAYNSSNMRTKKSTWLTGMRIWLSSPRAVFASGLHVRDPWRELE